MAKSDKNTVNDVDIKTLSPLVPPFTEETARAKVKAAEDAWNTCNPDIVALAYTVELVKGEQKFSLFLKLNLLGQVPVLVDDGVVTAIFK